MIGYSPIAFPCVTTMFHLVSSFVLIVTQWPAAGSSALIGYGGRCTARTVSEQTNENSPIIIATNVLFKTVRRYLLSVVPSKIPCTAASFRVLYVRRLSGMAPLPGGFISHLVLRERRNEVLEAERRLSCPQAVKLEPISGLHRKSIEPCRLNHMLSVEQHGYD